MKKTPHTNKCELSAIQSSGPGPQKLEASDFKDGNTCSGELALEVRHLSKAYGATQALRDVSFSVSRGTTHALLGENGAGKSTVIKLLSGLVRPDSGTIQVLGKEVDFRTPLDAQFAGLQTAFQELALFPDRTVLQNMIVAHEPRWGFGLINWRAARASVETHFATLGLNDVDLNSEISSLSLSQRQKIEIAKALYRDPTILFLDEATASLSANDVEWLERVVADLKLSGATVVMITHKMQEIRQFCDSFTILRNGCDVGTFAAGSISDDEIVELIIGRTLEATFPRRNTIDHSSAPVIEARHLTVGKRLNDCTFNLQPGEIVGVAALQGMGQKELFDAMFGVVPLEAGEFSLCGRPITLGSPRDAIDVGIALVPEERKSEGLFLDLSGLENMVMPSLDHLTRFGLLSRKREANIAGVMMEQVQLPDRALYQPAAAFSGGNQQKIVIGKWLMTAPRLLLLFDPCRGVDIGTKHEIYTMIDRFARAGGSVLIHSSETPELSKLCQRVIVLYRGKIAEVLASPGPDTDISETEIMRAMLGEQKPLSEVTA